MLVTCCRNSVGGRLCGRESCPVAGLQELQYWRLEYRVGQGGKGEGETTPNTVGNVCVPCGVAVHNSRMKWQKGVAGMVVGEGCVVVVGSSSSSSTR